MPTSASDRLEDAIEAADAIAALIAGVGIADFRTSNDVRFAVSYHFIVIGESLNALSKDHPDVGARLPGLPRVVGFRNILIHRYHVVDYDEVFAIASKDLPRLRREIAELLADIEK